MTAKGLLTTTVGSFSKPDYLAKARTAHAAGKLSDKELFELEKKATKEIIALQEEIGLDILVDGARDARRCVVQHRREGREHVARELHARVDEQHMPPARRSQAEVARRARPEVVVAGQRAHARVAFR
jgi:hypothetical protein